MSLPTKNGRYIARPTSIIVEPKPTGAVQAKIDFSIVAFLNGTTEEPVTDGSSIFEYFTIINTNGQPNEINVTSIRDSMGWVGGFSDLTALDLTGLEVQIVVDDKTYNGKTNKTVKYLNPRDYVGKGPGVTDPGVVADLDAKFGAMLRAMAPASNQPAKPRAAASAASRVADAASNGKDLAWREMQLKVQSYNNENPLDAISDESATKAFKDLFTKHFPGKTSAQLTPSDWAEFRNAIKVDFSAALMSEVPF